ncbi:aspartate 4-decarboxylase [Enterococcus avium]|uniref:aspartate 4-decarboxylase n=1 Tax=Enterococcus TaxID=1350 RepID=UPI00159D01DF|nr:aspartate 4-decarboxylase [Enterococcus avium]NVN57890.1 aspartate 4-decarboxylase [Enterococcus avium]NVN71971.1 aspartate 4-decarboxylase [Enterococcus avium]
MSIRDEEQQLEKLGAFEISNEMLKLAQHNKKSNIFLNAGRGNPNWINTKARLAFARIIEFGAKESSRTISEGDLAGYTTLEGIRERLETFLSPKTSEIDQFLIDAVNYAHDTLKIDKDEFVKELVDGVIGNNYPVPSRILKHSERVINAYLESTLYRGEKLAEQTDLFPTEGGTAAIVYIFNSLKENKLIKQGDKIAINTPIFTPYLQIPELNDYEMVEVDLRSDEEHNWEIQASELDKLAELTTRYSINVLEPEKMKFIDRMVADSRSVGLYHTSGLSTPQQIMEVLFSLTHLLSQEKDVYIETSKAIVNRRYEDLFKGLNIEGNASKENSKYYSLINIYQLAEKIYGSEFKKYLMEQFEQVDFLYNLSQKNGVVLMDGVGFGSQPGELRVSEANLPDEDYEIIAKQILELIDEYHQSFLQQ